MFTYVKKKLNFNNLCPCIFFVYIKSNLYYILWCEEGFFKQNYFMATLILDADPHFNDVLAYVKPKSIFSYDNYQ